MIHVQTEESTTEVGLEANDNLSCIVTCSGYRCAMPASRTVQVLEVDRLVSLPLTPPWILGITFYESLVLPICSVAELDADPASPVEGASDRSRLAVVLKHQGSRFGLCIDEILGFRTLEPEDERPAELAALRAVQAGSASDQGHSVVVLDVDRLYNRLKPAATSTEVPS